MAIDSNTIKRTSNIIQINGVNFKSNFNKKLHFENIDFSDSDVVYAAPAYMASWLNRGKTGGVDDISWKSSPQWYQGWIAYDKEIDVQELQNDGVKYLYCLGSFYKNRSTDVHSITQSSIGTYNKTNGVYQLQANNLENFSHDPIVSDIAVDEQVALRGGYDAHILEVYVGIDELLTLGMNIIYFGCVHESVPNTETIISQYPNTAIDRPIVYMVYED